MVHLEEDILFEIQDYLDDLCNVSTSDALNFDFVLGLYSGGRLNCDSRKLNISYGLRLRNGSERAQPVAFKGGS
jgi:hypothetical protein